MSIGENIAKLRNDRSMSQSEVANGIGVTQSYIAQIERGSKIPTLLLSDQIAKFFGVPINDLLA
jgi:transcriptional regulator with XRE-family HTH domain